MKTTVTTIKTMKGRISHFKATLGGFEADGASKNEAETNLDKLIERHKDYGWSEVVKFCRDDDGPVVFVLRCSPYGWSYSINRPGKAPSITLLNPDKWITQRQAEQAVDDHIKGSFTHD